MGAVAGRVSRPALLLAAGLVLFARGASAACVPTEVNPQGPFYLPGAPLQERLAPDDEPGERLVVAGKVLSAGDCRPLAGAELDVWQASAAGVYYGMEGAGGPGSGKWRLRGRVRTGSDGAYRFETVLPGRYPGRPRHIHFLVTHPGYRSLVTQLYFAGDADRAGDELVRPNLIVPLVAAGGPPGGAQRFSAVFDLVLAPAP